MWYVVTVGGLPGPSSYSPDRWRIFLTSAYFPDGRVVPGAPRVFSRLSEVCGPVMKLEITLGRDGLRSLSSPLWSLKSFRAGSRSTGCDVAKPSLCSPKSLLRPGIVPGRNRILSATWGSRRTLQIFLDCCKLRRVTYRSYSHPVLNPRLAVPALFFQGDFPGHFAWRLSVPQGDGTSGSLLTVLPFPVNCIKNQLPPRGVFALFRLPWCK